MRVMSETYDKDFYRSPMAIFKSQIRKDLKGVEPEKKDLMELGVLAGISHWVEKQELGSGWIYKAHYEWNDGVWSSLNRKWIKYLLDRVKAEPFTLQEAYAIRDGYDGRGDRQGQGNPTGVSLFACVHRGVMERLERAKYRFLVEELP